VESPEKNATIAPSRWILTVDVWDTLLRRKCHPDEVKLASAKHLLLQHWQIISPEYRNQLKIFEVRKDVEIEIGNKSRATGMDDEYEILEVWLGVVTRVLDQNAKESRRDIAANIALYEIEFEGIVSYPDDKIQQWLNTHARDAELHFLSDFYLKSEHLLDLVSKKHPELFIKHGLSSASAGLNKRSGRLFGHFKDGLTDQSVLHRHVGDNPHSDVDVPRSQGIDATLYINEAEELLRARMSEQFTMRLKGDLKNYWAILTDSLGAPTQPAITRQQRLEKLACKIAPLFVLYVIFAIQEARKLGLNKVYYFTREGEILKQIHDKIKLHAGEKNIPDAVLLEVSRISTFGPSLNDLDFAELNRIWTMYPRQSLAAFLGTLGLVPENFQHFAIQAGLKVDEVIDRPWLDSRFASIISDEQFRAQALNELQQKKAVLKNYLSQKGINENTEQVLIVDIGWRGTIQDNLSKILPDTHWNGLYLALFKFLNPQPSNVSKTGYLFDDNRGTAFEKHISPQAPLEMLFNSPNGSVIGYKVTETVSAERLVANAENHAYHTFSRFIQEKILSSSEKIWDLMEQRALLATDFSDRCRDLAAAVLANPGKEMADAFFCLEHNETFGNNAFVSHKSSFPYAKLLRHVRRPRTAIALLRQSSHESGWVGGFYSANRINWIKNLYLEKIRPFRIKAHVLCSSIKSIWNNGDANSNLVTNKSIKPLLDKITNIDLHNPELTEFNKFHATERHVDDNELTINWLVPDFGYGSGGHVTILRFARHFQTLGIRNRIYVHGESAHGSDENLRRFINLNVTQVDNVEIYYKSATMASADILISTFWLTAYDAYQFSDTKFKAYFIQDFEPHFYPMGSNWILAEDTYRFGFYGICASRWLHSIAQKYQMESCYFNLGYEPSVYYPDPLAKRDPDRVLVYMRPLTERRGTELLIATIAIIKKLRPKTRVAIFGTDSLGYTDLPFDVDFLGLLNEEQLRLQHSSSTVTLLTSLTNYSLIPIEAMACGAAVVDVNVESMRETFGESAPILLAPPRPLDMAKAVIAVLDDESDACRRSAASIEYAKKFAWGHAFQSVENSLFGAYFSHHTTRQMETYPNLVHARDGSKIFYIDQNVRYDINSYETFISSGFDIADVQQISIKELLLLSHGGNFKPA